QLHRARLRARVGGRTHRPLRWQGARTRARGEGVRLDPRRNAGRSCSMTETTTVITRPEDQLIRAFEQLQGASLNGSATVSGLRAEAIERFAALGLPTSKNEAWKYTNIARALRHEYDLE